MWMKGGITAERGPSTYMFMGERERLSAKERWGLCLSAMRRSLFSEVRVYIPPLTRSCHSDNIPLDFAFSGHLETGVMFRVLQGWSGETSETCCDAPFFVCEPCAEGV